MKVLKAEVLKWSDLKNETKDRNDLKAFVYGFIIQTKRGYSHRLTES